MKRLTLRGGIPMDAAPLPKPRTRAELFRQALRLHVPSMVAPNLCCTLAYLPALIWAEVAMQRFPTSESAATAAQEQYLVPLLLGLFVCLTLTGPVQAGMALLMRNWARNESCYRFATMWGGLKRNWKQALPVAAIGGIVPLLFYSTFRYYGQMSENASALYLIPLALTGLLCVFLLLMQQTVYTLLVTYALPLGKLLKNAFVLAVLELPKSLLVLLLSALPIAGFAALIALMPSRLGLLLVLGCAYYALIGLALERFLFASFANYACEKHMNSKIPGARVDIGLTTERTVCGMDAQGAAASS